MNRLKLMLLVLGLFLTMQMPALASNRAEEIYRSCVDKVHELRERCVNLMETQTAACLARIEELQNAGQNDVARLVAQDCISRLEREAATCNRKIDEACARCVNALRELRAYGLAEQLINVCRENKVAVTARARSLIERIRAQF